MATSGITSACWSLKRCAQIVYEHKISEVFSMSKLSAQSANTKNLTLSNKYVHLTRVPYMYFFAHTHTNPERRKKNKSLIGMKMWVNRDETGVEAVTFR